MSKRYDYETLFCDSVRELLECVPHHWYSCLGVLRAQYFCVYGNKSAVNNCDLQLANNKCLSSVLVTSS